MSQTRKRRSDGAYVVHENIDPIKRDRILSNLMREYSKRKITLEQIKQRDPQSSRKVEDISFAELWIKSHS